MIECSSNGHHGIPSQTGKQYLNTTRSKLLMKSYWPFEVTGVNGDLITINENSTRHSISVDRVSQDCSSGLLDHAKITHAIPSPTQNRPNSLQLT